MCKKKNNQSINSPILQPDTTNNPILQPATTMTNDNILAGFRFERWKSEDPFPLIPPALLNSADILSYVNAVSIICPFYPEDLSGASYDVGIYGKVIYFEASDKDNEVIKKEIDLIKDGDSFDLLPNSIAFVTLEPTFRIPDYLALRFNLKITHIYKGLLLGTGPLVDPGFVGKLSIPLHNLTNNTYRFFKGDKLITMEFTKMSDNSRWKNKSDYNYQQNRFISSNIPPNRTVDQYITKALKTDRLKHVVSSIPAAMQESKKDVKEAREAIRDYEKRSHIQTTISIIAVVTLAISLIALSINAINKANERYDRLKDEYFELQEQYSQKYEELIQKIDELNEEIDSLHSKE